ncbi:hypothetical protein BBF96_14960 [Anoxybacter fermentans]|uniref:Peptidase S8/S53 domain-containing protein n=2 Tax=Bacteria TaxID=2 RepID=A0A3S9T1U1_9FIRM|nr:S8 family serine peptidase [Anoxybacter fermentans]AZR74573.1 hypothetical protein BBF96_14960 [Anoxybacter fermentans]
MRRKFVSVLLTIALLLFVVLPTPLFADMTKNLNNSGEIATWDSYMPEIHLKGYKIKPNQKISLPYNLKKSYSVGEEGPYIIVFSGPIEEPMKAWVAKEGAKLVEYIPDFSFLALMTPEVAARVEALPFVVDVMIYHPAFKIHPSLKDEQGNIKGYGDVTVNILTFGKDISVLDNEIKNAHATKLYGKNGKAVVKLNRGQLIKFAHLNAVKYIEEVPEYQLLNDVAKGYIDVDDLWNLGYDGSGQVVGVADTGLDTGVNDSSMHLDFQGRIDAIFALGRSTADDPHGHGTHVAGSVLGNGARSNGQIKGMAPGAHLVFQSVMDSNGGLGGLPADLNDLFAQAWNAGARIHTNSWGAAVYGDYTTNSREVDEYVWNNDMIILFAAGNEGDGSDGSTVYQSISAPGTAKNCITVGASENYRPSKGSYADNPNEIARFSSRGWTEDGRVKPDVVAPGTWILSTKSSVAPDSNFWGLYDQYYAYMGGTSMATPITAGAVAVARQYMQTEWGHTPSPAMMKAAIINGVTDLGYGVPSKDQGWGRVSLVDSLISKEYKFEDETYSLSTGQSKTFSYYVESIYTPLRITLVWTDYPGSTSASKALVNDLDLVVTSPSGIVYYGNDFTSPYNSEFDRVNNVENVWIDNPEVGIYTIEIRGYNVPQGPQPFALFASGDFGTDSSDTISPTVNITAPSNGATVSGTVAYSADASDNVGVTQVKFFIDGVLVGTDTTAPYSISWDTTNYSNGDHNLVAKAYDAAGNVGTSSTVTVTVNNTNSTTIINERFTGYVSSSGDADEYFYIDVTAPGTIGLTLSWNSSDDLDMYLYDPSGNQVARAYTLNNPEVISYDATITGRYMIRVNAYSGSEEYLLEVSHPIDANITAHYEDSDFVDNTGTRSINYYITVGNSGTINVELTWNTSADLDIFLYDPSGNEVARAYSLRNPESISYPVSTTGTYIVKVDAYSGSATYTVKINYPK